MKRLLPLLLGLAVSVAQADSNSDYRAGSDFARQIQGQGTGSIQGFKPQESIPGYNANPDETKYYGGVTAGGDGGLKNDGTTEWATGETGKTITESFMNKPKDILSPDAPFIQTVYGSTTYCNFYSLLKYIPRASLVRAPCGVFCCYTAPDIPPASG